MKQLLDIDGDGTDFFILSTGREFYANFGCIGIGPSDGGYQARTGVQYGSDGDIDTDDWTKEEKIELADYMIGLWQEYKLKASNEKGE